MGAITEVIAATFYKEVSDELYDFTVAKLPEDLKRITIDFEKFANK